MKPKKYPYSGFQKTDNKQDRVKFDNDGKIIKWVKSKKYMGGKVWSKRT